MQTILTSPVSVHTAFPTSCTSMTSNNIAYHFDGPEPIVVTTWKISKANFPISQSPFVVFTYRMARNSFGEELKYKIELSGIIVKQSCKSPNDIVQPGDVLFRYELCTHDTLMKDLCAVCGVNIEKLDTDLQKRIAANTSVAMVHSIPELRVSREVAEDLGRADETRLLNVNKLVLLVDLDQTIIHSTNQEIPEEVAAVANIKRYCLYGPSSPQYCTKFRPFMQEFLEEISKYYELHICTFGARRYAHKIAELINNEIGQYFPNDRILSRDEFFDPCSKTGNMKSLFPCGDSMVCIIDDRVDVWKYAANVVQVKPYVCFKTDDINAPEKLNIGYKGSDTTFDQIESDDDKEDKNKKATKPKDDEPVDDGKEADEKPKEETEEENKEADEKDETQSKTEDDEEDKKQKAKEKEISDQKHNSELYQQLIEDSDDYLVQLKEILIRIHKEYFREYNEKRKYRSEGEEIVIPDLKQVIPRVRRRILQGVNLVFSSVIATNAPPKSNRFYRLAELLGAIITDDVIVNGSPKTTHLVAAKWGTTKVNRCLKHPEIKMVTPEWLLACLERWEKVDETSFTLSQSYVYDMNSRDEHKKIFIPFNKHDQEEKTSISLPSTSGSATNPKTIFELSPLANFSTNDIDEMEKEVEDEISGDDEDGDDDDDEDEAGDDDDDDEENVSYADEGEYPRGWRPNKGNREQRKYPLKRSREEFDEAEDESEESNSTSSSTSEDGSIGSVDDEMVAALERELNSE